MHGAESGGRIDIVGTFALTATVNAKEFMPTTRSAHAISSYSSLSLDISNFFPGNIAQINL